MPDYNTELTSETATRTTGDKVPDQESINASVMKPLISETELRTFLHDLHGPLACALGFTEELTHVRESMQKLADSLQSTTSDDLANKTITALRLQIDEEMELCLNRVKNSLVKLDSRIDSIQCDIKSTD